MQPAAILQVYLATYPGAGLKRADAAAKAELLAELEAEGAEEDL